MAMSGTAVADGEAPQGATLISPTRGLCFNMNAPLTAPRDSKIWYREALRRLCSNPMEAESWCSLTACRQLDWLEAPSFLSLGGGAS